MDVENVLCQLGTGLKCWIGILTTVKTRTNSTIKNTTFEAIGTSVMAIRKMVTKYLSFFLRKETITSWTILWLVHTSNQEEITKKKCYKLKHKNNIQKH